MPQRVQQSFHERQQRRCDRVDALCLVENETVSSVELLHVSADDVGIVGGKREESHQHRSDQRREQ